MPALFGPFAERVLGQAMQTIGHDRLVLNLPLRKFSPRAARGQHNTSG
jgi:hypothetical protein